MKNTILWIILSVVVLGLGYYTYTKKSNKKNILDIIKDKLQKSKAFLAPKNLTLDNCDTLHLDDVVAYFRNMQLKPKIHSPFISKAKVLKGAIPESIILEEHSYIVGVYNEESDNIENAKIINAKNIDNKLREIIGDDILVVLQ